ncbi:predicted protein [Verticillium alfalfae VaMs.102]|uniref:Predicted protein n=1 Tax=Verticillium alfalfae (strain VaMs.102 / ATCC MYA-4576 / FGSC 10136) TaxID=526221 RepID=C9SC31_VERA1|nr:predicted protein [Verticillium alfalfae VaMs.102]EEY15915.1 predicted protein [Verticillium alfalfae VaMs.102]
MAGQALRRQWVSTLAAVALKTSFTLMAVVSVPDHREGEGKSRKGAEASLHAVDGVKPADGSDRQHAGNDRPGELVVQVITYCWKCILKRSQQMIGHLPAQEEILAGLRAMGNMFTTGTLRIR